MKKSAINTAILIIFVLCVSVFVYKRYNVPPAIDLPEISLTDLNGHKVSLNAYAGRPLFLSFFATWCGPCMRELPELADLRMKLSDEHLQLVCISDEPIERLLALQAHFGGQLIILHSAKNFHDIGIYTYPTNYIFNAKGNKVYEKVNPDDWENPDMIRNIKQLIEK